MPSDINDPEAIRFVNEHIRPLSEAFRALKVRLEEMDDKWQTVGSFFPNDSSPVQDGREAEGVSRLTGQDINDSHYGLSAAAQAITDAVVEKPCVRPLEVTIPQS